MTRSISPLKADAIRERGRPRNRIAEITTLESRTTRTGSGARSTAILNGLEDVGLLDAEIAGGPFPEREDLLPALFALEVLAEGLSEQFAPRSPLRPSDLLHTTCEIGGKGDGHGSARSHVAAPVRQCLTDDGAARRGAVRRRGAAASGGHRADRPRHRRDRRRRHQRRGVHLPPTLATAPLPLVGVAASTLSVFEHQPLVRRSPRSGWGRPRSRSPWPGHRRARDADLGLVGMASRTSGALPPAVARPPPPRTGLTGSPSAPPRPPPPGPGAARWPADSVRHPGRRGWGSSGTPSCEPA